MHVTRAITWPQRSRRHAAHDDSGDIYSWGRGGGELCNAWMTPWPREVDGRSIRETRCGNKSGAKHSDDDDVYVLKESHCAWLRAISLDNFILCRLVWLLSVHSSVQLSVSRYLFMNGGRAGLFCINCMPYHFHARLCMIVLWRVLLNPFVSKLNKSPIITLPDSDITLPDSVFA